MADAVVTLGLDAGPFIAGINRAEANAKTFTRNIGGNAMWDFMGPAVPAANKAMNRIERNAGGFTHRLSQLFRRDTEHRASITIGNVLGDLATGNLAGAVQNLHNISGLGLAAGVGIGVAVIAFEKFKHQIDEATAADRRLRAELAKPVSLQAGLGEEGINHQLELVEKGTKELEEKHKTFGSKLRQFFFALPGGGPGVTSGGRDYVKESKDIISGMQRQKELSAALADAELDKVQTRQMGLRDSEEEAAMLEIAAKAEEKRSKLFLERGLTKPGRSAFDLFKSSSAINQDEKLSREEAAKKFDIKRQQEEVENRILDLHASSLTKEQQSLAAIRERINLLKRELTLPGSQEHKSELGVKLHGLEVQENQSLYTESRKPWTQRSAEMREQRRYQNFTNRQTPSNLNAYLSSPDAYNRRDILGNQVDAAGNFAGGPPKTAEKGPQSREESSATIVGKLDSILSEIQKWGN